MLIRSNSIGDNTNGVIIVSNHINRNSRNSREWNEPNIRLDSYLCVMISHVSSHRSNTKPVCIIALVRCQVFFRDNHTNVEITPAERSKPNST